MLSSSSLLKNSFISVSIIPNATAFTWILEGASSFASAFVNEFIPPLLAEYALSHDAPTTPHIEEILIIWPLPAFNIFGMANLEQLKTDVKIGNINIQGNDSVGYRMQKIFTSNAKYFDYITADGENGKVTVGGTHNIGISIAKDLSNSKDSKNAISNLKNLNVTVDGRNDGGTVVSENVGFLRTGDSDNNTAPMLLNSTTMGTFDFGSNAFDSTLIRSDAYNVEIQKDITINNGHANGGNVIGVANDTSSRGTNPSKTNVISTAKLTSNNQYKFRGLLSNGGNASVENKGGIEILGDKDEGIGIAAINDGDLKTQVRILK